MSENNNNNNNIENGSQQPQQPKPSTQQNSQSTQQQRPTIYTQQHYNQKAGAKQASNVKVPMSDFRTSVLNPQQIKPALSMTKFRIIAGVLGSIAFYVTCVSELGDHTGQKKNVTTEFREKHDRFMSNLLGFDVREKIRKLEKGFFELRDGTGKKVESAQLPETTNNTTTTTTDQEQSNLFLNAATGGRMDIVKPDVKYATEMDRVRALIKSNDQVSLKLEQKIEKEFQEILDKKYGVPIPPTTESNN